MHVHLQLRAPDLQNNQRKHFFSQSIIKLRCLLPELVTKAESTNELG